MARVRAFSSWGLSHCGNTLSPTLSRKRERECSSLVAATAPHVVVLQFEASAALATSAIQLDATGRIASLKS